ncbi:MAG: Serine dehydratase alpha chain [Acidobacteria bacterium ADurb.Bin340]|nr:MAG: Serine dehydratase alpha chain [Acidobacteria bacterium ADurb.Bin340]
MRLSDLLESEWKPALGCTEPAAVAWAAALAAAQSTGTIQRVHLVCDPRTYKNCYAVGLPNAGKATGLLWALALGACLTDDGLGLRSFEAVGTGTLEAARALLERRALSVEVDATRDALRIEVTVVRSEGQGRAVLDREHTHLASLERNGQRVGGLDEGAAAKPPASLRERLAGLRIQDLLDLARSATPEDRVRLQEGITLNLAIARHGLSLLPPGFVAPTGLDTQTRLARLVSAGVHARMSGASLTVMTLAGSGNKGITVTVPVALWGREVGHPEARVEEALAFGAGMICDGAKIGCALKTMTGVDAAFRSAHMALSGIGIPATDGIVGRDGETSLANLGRLAQEGMAQVDASILAIMQAKLEAQDQPSGY